MSVFVSIAAIILGTTLLGEVAQRIGQPAVLGELLAGVLLGASVFGIVDPHEPVVHALADLGVMVLLFEIGLHTDVRALRRVGGSALVVAAVGVIVPFLGGVGVARLFGVPAIPALVAGAALTATSIGISARVLSDIGKLHSPEGQIVLAAAVADDVIGLIILSVVSSIVAGTSIDAWGVLKITAVAVGFVVGALALASLAIPPLFRVVERIRLTGALALIAFAFALLLGVLAEASGSARIIGAFAAGLILHPTPQRAEIERNVATLGTFLVPVFFAVVGASVDLRALVSGPALGIGTALIVVGVLGKLAAGYAPWWFEGSKLLVGVAMIPRGEVGLIFAGMGMATGAISAGLFGALTLMVAVTTLITPPALTRIVRTTRGPASGEFRGDGGIDDLVAGARVESGRKTVALKRPKPK